MKAVRRVKCPVIVAHSRDGEMIPYAMGRRLFDAAPEPKRFVELHGGRNERGLGYASESLRLIVDAVTEGIPAPVRAPEPKPDPRLTIGRDTVDPCADCCLSAHREVSATGGQAALPLLFYTDSLASHRLPTGGLRKSADREAVCL
jgi:hypothetical protein